LSTRVFAAPVISAQPPFMVTNTLVASDFWVKMADPTAS
jgi:hypothetical protein